jgi:hypothetical protein
MFFFACFFFKVFFFDNFGKKTSKKNSEFFQKRKECYEEQKLFHIDLVELLFLVKHLFHGKIYGKVFFL